MRGRIVRDYSRLNCRARVWSTRARGERSRTWHYIILSTENRVVLYDNMGDFNTAMRTALIRVEALRHMERAGHLLPQYRPPTPMPPTRVKRRYDFPLAV